MEADFELSAVVIRTKDAEERNRYWENIDGLELETC